MNKIEVAILNEAHNCPAGMMMFLAKLTQRGHNIHCMDDLMKLYNDSMGKHKTATAVANLPHGTIKRFTPITVAIVGASRRFLAQARTHQVGFNYVSASLQYSDYSGKADFVVPYALTKWDIENNAGPESWQPSSRVQTYLTMCEHAMAAYKDFAEDTDNDTAGYVAPQGLRNILIMQANHESWMHFIRLRGCNRNTNETQFVTMKIWEELLKTEDGKEMFHYAGPDCMFGKCREGKMCCGKPLTAHTDLAIANNISTPQSILREQWPLIMEVNK